jgi:hypothetical protein
MRSNTQGIMAMRPSRTTLLWTVPVLFFLHNLEKVLFLRATLEQVHQGMPRFLRVVIPPVSYEQYVVSLVGITLAAFCFAAFGHLERPKGWGLYLLLGLQAAIFINVFANVLSWWVVGTYTAGSLTSLVIDLPFSLYLFWKALRQQWLSSGEVTLTFFLGALGYYPIFFGFLFFAGFVSRQLFGV